MLLFLHYHLTGCSAFGCACLTLWLSMRLRTRSMSPCTGWSSASWGSTLYSQSIRACRASVNCPENNSASSSLFCLRGSERLNQQQPTVGLEVRRAEDEGFLYLSTDLPHTVSHLSLSSLSMSSSFCLSSWRLVLSLSARPVRLVVSYTECLLPRAFWNSCQSQNATTLSSSRNFRHVLILPTNLSETAGVYFCDEHEQQFAREGGEPNKRGPNSTAAATQRLGVSQSKVTP